MLEKQLFPVRRAMNCFVLGIFFWQDVKRSIWKTWAGGALKMP